MNSLFFSESLVALYFASVLLSSIFYDWVAYLDSFIFIDHFRISGISSIAWSSLLVLLSLLLFWVYLNYFNKSLNVVSFFFPFLRNAFDFSIFSLGIYEDLFFGGLAVITLEILSRSNITSASLREAEDLLCQFFNSFSNYLISVPFLSKIYRSTKNCLSRPSIWGFHLFSTILVFFSQLVISC